MRFSVQLRNQMFVKGYKLLCFAEKIGKDIIKKICKIASSKYSQTLLNHAKQAATDVL